MSDKIYRVQELNLDSNSNEVLYERHFDCYEKALEEVRRRTGRRGHDRECGGVRKEIEFFTKPDKYYLLVLRRIYVW